MGCGSSKWAVHNHWDIEKANLSSSVASTKRSLVENVVRRNFVDIKELYEIENGRRLGSGASGQVKICRCRQTGTEYALKTLTKTNVDPEKVEQVIIK